MAKVDNISSFIIMAITESMQALRQAADTLTAELPPPIVIEEPVFPSDLILQ
jgi:hypothetical protein